MLCEPEYDEEDQLTGIGPAEISNRCVPACCPRTIKLQIRTRYKTGTARLCGDVVDPEAAPPEDPDDIEYHTTATQKNTWTKWQNAEPEDTKLGTCRKTIVYVSGEAAFTAHETTLPDCNGSLPEETWDPEDCFDTLNDPPTDYTTFDAVLEVSGDAASRNMVRDEAISAMAAQEWSEWADLIEIDPISGTAAAGYLEHELSFSSLSDNSITTGAGFIASAVVMESEIRVWGALPLHISTTEGTSLDGTITRTILTPGTPISFVVDDPENNDTWQPENITLRCACPAQFAPLS